MKIALGMALTSARGALSVALEVRTNTQIVVINGQSNTRRQDTTDNGQTWASNTWEYDQSGTLNQLTGTDDMDLRGTNDNLTGLEFARSKSHSFRAQHPDAKLVFVHGGEGGTGFADDNWNDGDTLFEAQVTRYAAAKAALETLGETVEHYATIWGNGEKEAKSTADDLRLSGQRLDAAITAFQADIGEPNGAVLISPPGSTGYTDDSDLAIASVIWTDTRNRLPNVGTISALTDGPSGGPFIDRGDGLHHSAATMQAIGTNLHARWNNLSGASSAAVPSAPTGVSAVYDETDEDVTVTGTAGSSNGSAIFGYDVYRKLSSSPTWVKLNTNLLASLSYVDTAPLTGEDVDYAFTAWNGKGESTQGAAPTITIPGTGATFPTTNLVHRYALDSLTTGIEDSVGSVDFTDGSNSTVVNDATYGNVIEIGSTGTITMPDTEPSITGDFTMQMWIRPASGTAGIDRAAFGIRSADSTDPREIRFAVHFPASANTVATSVVTNNDIAEMTSAIAQDAWVYVGVTYDSSTGTSQLCVNGVAVASFVSFSGMEFVPGASNLFAVGSYNAGDIAEDCRVRDLAIWNKVLTTQELSDAYASTQ